MLLVGIPQVVLTIFTPFVITTYTNIPDPFSGNAIDDNGGSNSMAFYNMQLETSLY